METSFLIHVQIVLVQNIAINECWPKSDYGDGV